LTFEDSDKSESFCCFAYSGLTSDNHCNLPKGQVPRDLRERCQKKSKTTVKDRELWETTFLKEKIDQDQGSWAACVCQGIGGLPEATAAWDPCKAVPEKGDQSTKSPTTTSPSTTIKTRPIIDNCVVSPTPVEKWCSCVNDPSRNISLESFLFQVEGQKEGNMFQTCHAHTSIGNDDDYKKLYFGLAVVGTNGSDWKAFYLGQSDSLRSEYYCTSGGQGIRNTFYKNLIDARNFKLFDCFGNNVDIEKNVDDCGNYKLSYPDDKGKEVQPTLQEVPLTKEYFLCCWNYFVDGFDPTSKRLLENGLCGLGGTNYTKDSSIVKDSCAIRRKGDDGCDIAITNNVNDFHEKKCPVGEKCHNLDNIG